MKASIIIPTRHRAWLLEKRLKTLLKHTPELFNGEAELIIAGDIDDTMTYDMLENLYLHTTGIKWLACLPLDLPCNKWNVSTKMAKGDWLVTISDDCVPINNWLRNAFETPNKGFIGLPDGVTGGRNLSFTPLYMATRDWLIKNNGGVLVIPKYKSWYADIETCMRAQRSNTYVVGFRSTCTQLHTCFGTAKNDEMYKLGESRRQDDQQMFIYRQINNFPDDFERCL